MRLFTALLITLLSLSFTSIAQAWWKPKSDQRILWQLQLQGKINTTVKAKMFDIDLFDTPKNTIAALHKRGKIVICYFSAGTAENWRTDYKNFPRQVLGKKDDGWAGERWLDVGNFKTIYSGKSIAKVMLARLDLAKSKGCDGVDPDNVNGYSNNTGFPITREQQKAYDQWLATQAHTRDLSVGLKNTLGLIDELVDHFDFAVNEQCYQYHECKAYASSFINANKAVFWVEYTNEPHKPSFNIWCRYSQRKHLNFLEKNLDLKAWQKACSKQYDWGRKILLLQTRALASAEQSP